MVSVSSLSWKNGCHSGFESRSYLPRGKCHGDSENSWKEDRDSGGGGVAWALGLAQV